MNRTEADLKEIEANQAKILALEGKILKEDDEIKEMASSTFGFINRFRSGFVKKVSRRKVVYGVLVTAGMVGVWRGTWYILDEIPWLHSPYASIAFGLTLLLILKKINDLSDH